MIYVLKSTKLFICWYCVQGLRFCSLCNGYTEKKEPYNCCKNSNNWKIPFNIKFVAKKNQKKKFGKPIECKAFVVMINEIFPSDRCLCDVV